MSGLTACPACSHSQQWPAPLLRQGPLGARAFAALAAAVVLPPEYGVPLPQPADLPAPVRDDIERFRAHPAGVYALGLFSNLRRNAVTQPAES